MLLGPKKLSDQQQAYLKDASIKLKQSINKFLNWKQCSRQYSEILMATGGSFHIQYTRSPDAYTNLRISQSNAHGATGENRLQTTTLLTSIYTCY